MQRAPDGGPRFIRFAVPKERERARGRPRSSEDSPGGSVSSGPPRVVPCMQVQGLGAGTVVAASPPSAKTLTPFPVSKLGEGDKSAGILAHELEFAEKIGNKRTRKCVRM